MRTLSRWPLVLVAATALSSHAARAGDADSCRQQADQIITRLQAEVVGTLSGAQQASANRIVLDVCQLREQAVQAEVEQAVQQTREEEQAKATTGGWFSESPNKPGNKRLKRKAHY